MKCLIVDSFRHKYNYYTKILVDLLKILYFYSLIISHFWAICNDYSTILYTHAIYRKKVQA
jgi:hypothetical protein